MASKRFNARVEEEFGADNCMLRGAHEVMLYLMFDVPVRLRFVDQLLKLIN